MFKPVKRDLHTETRKNVAPPKKSKFVHPVHNMPNKTQKASRKPTPPKAMNAMKGESPTRTASPTANKQLKRKRHSVTPQPVWDSDDSELDPQTQKTCVKRDSTIEPDPTRTIRSRKAFSDEDGGQFSMVHAADIANSKDIKFFHLAFPDFPNHKDISLQYPSASQREKYELVIPRSDDDFKPLLEIREVMEMIAAHYLPSDTAETVTDDSTGVIRRLKRASSRLAGGEYSKVIDEWNQFMEGLREDGALEKSISEWKAVDLKLCEFVLMQTYARTVSLEVNDLKKYKNGEDNVYGELLPKFVSMILKQDLKVKADQVFVDLGSGVGNVVLQAALQVGCESWGCEMMPNACKLANLQKTEFEARCRLWGLSKGEIHLERGDFLTNQAISKVLPRADVVLVNNQAFTPDLNEKLTNLFLDLRDGAKVVSLKSFAPVGQQNQSRSAGAIHNILDASEKKYFSHCVSWTDAAGTYYVATKDSTRVKSFG